MRTQRRHTARPTRRRAARLIALPGVALLGLGLAAQAAPAVAAVAAVTAVGQAGPSDTPVVADAPTAAQLSDAHRAAGSAATLRVLESFFARDGLPPGQKGRLSPAQEATAAEAADPRLVGGTVPVYSLNPEFVTATSAERTPVATMEFAASEAVDADGDTASVWTARVSGKWQVVNIATGSDETDYAARAEAGSVVFREPQLNAWYRVTDGRVMPLNKEARASVGAGGTGLARYQRLVHRRYADKMPGSTYDEGGYAGGYDTGAERTQGSADARADSGATDTASVAAGTVALAGAGVAGVTGVAGGWLVRRRRLARR
ncbi:hypothetical protein [Streptomyces sp. AC512_CC834]|uniref:hypothetical protein n=1 Tax=Streptomyces sp. AC512_CC834 TaxID=2823691 RepID=UPI0020B66DB9|nr:hypothetical protein [Streptomyces sp. AC512_CC834]